MEIYLGDDGLKETWQANFPAIATCSHCYTTTARIAFVAKEEYDGSKPTDRQKFVCDLHKNGEDKKFWPHDCIAVAVYFCESCAKVSAYYNQA